MWLPPSPSEHPAFALATPTPCTPPPFLQVAPPAAQVTLLPGGPATPHLFHRPPLPAACRCSLEATSLAGLDFSPRLVHSGAPVNTVHVPLRPWLAWLAAPHCTGRGGQRSAPHSAAQQVTSLPTGEESHTGTGTAGLCRRDPAGGVLVSELLKGLLQSVPKSTGRPEVMRTAAWGPRSRGIRSEVHTAEPRAQRGPGAESNRSPWKV
ncbi:hypothetical protein P7K49_022677 [Saguinus oedipus]|uniref:Uncharacterized protein n=1 Tax=Saguinus oedipus TaxID=9490 RepID=A0ABQ9UJI6_SAGOE|nr:hypothetical protein P7K49_022677 [Saguinus oedipus]